MDITGNTTTTGTVVLASNLDADTYTITLTAGDAVLLVDTFTVEPVTIAKTDVDTAFSSSTVANLNDATYPFGNAGTLEGLFNVTLANTTVKESYVVNGEAYGNMTPVPSTTAGTYEIEATITFTAADNHSFNDATAYEAPEVAGYGWTAVRRNCQRRRFDPDSGLHWH